MPISERVRRSLSGGSLIRKMFEEGAAMKQRFGSQNVFDLSLGNPVMEPPLEFRNELKRLVEQPLPGMHRYMENAGYPETRAAVAAQLTRETGVRLGAGDVVMTCGAAGALNVVLKTLLNPGEEVIVFAPFFVEYPNYVDNFDGVTRVLPTDSSFTPRLDALEAAIGDKTRAVLINSPNNPTGVVYGEDLIRRMGEVLRAMGDRLGTTVFLISDEPYRKIIFDGLSYPSPLSHYSQSIVVSSHSKDLALPGERIGYIAVHSDCPDHTDLMNGLIYCNRTLGYVNAPALMQHVVRGLQNVTVAVNEYERKRDLLYARLTGMGYSLVKPQGAFYMFPKSPLENDVAFARELLEWRVLVVPGSGFGTPGYFRLSYCVDDRTLEGALDGFQRAAKKFRLIRRRPCTEHDRGCCR